MTDSTQPTPGDAQPQQDEKSPEASPAAPNEVPVPVQADASPENVVATKTIASSDSYTSMLKVDTQPDTAVAAGSAGTAPSISGGAAPPIGLQPPVAPQGNYAGFWLRFVAHLIDGFVSQALIIPIIIIGLIPFGFLHDDSNPVLKVMAGAYGVVFVLVVLSSGLLYFTLFECSKTQATPGKMALGLIVT
ncbi:MAG: RDD family protein, partial [Terriglobales bacterium]